LGYSVDQLRQARETDLIMLAQRYGVTLRRAAVNEFEGPCPVCGGDDRFAINIKKRTWLCRHCGGVGNKNGGKGAIDLVMHVEKCDFTAAVQKLTGASWTPSRAPGPIPAAVRAEAIDERPEAERALLSARRILSQITPLIGTPGEAYLRNVRNIDVAAIEDVLSRTDAIGWHPSVYFSHPADPTYGTLEHPLHGRRLGCIVGVMTDAVTAVPTGAISRTYLGPDGTKIGKAKTLGAPAGIVRLSADDVLGELCIAEGLETCLTGMANFGLRPLWSTGSAGAMADFPVLSGVEALTVIADHDLNGAGERAARAAEARWLAAGKEVALYRRDVFGDLNDTLGSRRRLAEKDDAA